MPASDGNLGYAASDLGNIFGRRAMILPLVVLVVSAAAIGAGIYVTVRGFKASAARAAGADGAHAPAAHAHAVFAHDQTATDLLKRFFDNKPCAICKRVIAPVQRTGPKPGLLNPETHETQAWDHIPNENLPAALDTHLPLCSACVLAESFRHDHPELVVDRDRSHGAHAPERAAARS
jgi:hypothetical protein